MSSAIQAKRREDYTPPSFTIDTVDLCFELAPSNTLVKSKLVVTRCAMAMQDLELDGEGLNLQSLHIDGRLAVEGSDYRMLDQGIVITLLDDKSIIEIENTISPEANSSLEGLYYVSGAYCTQCEAEGFRKITYFMDRPDVLSVYTVTIISDNDDLSYLLSNGNKIEDSRLDDGRRKVIWHDPHYKPCYLFALVAGHFDCLEDKYITSEGREVSLQVYVDPGRLHQSDHAMASLKRAMKWDEDTFGLAYDLDIYMIVAVDFFNMGAMENKGLNVFNSKFVLAEPSTATDDDYFNIESIIAHEYFHNWTGNRVTCRDWFQLSLKEGLTVFRDQKFSADMSSELGTRISQVKVMREHQFAEDAGPMSHPIRPDEVMEMNNFYTVTVYDKGAEVIRMLHTLLSAEGFRRGMDLYFKRHDGQAVTCDDFVQAMQDANDIDLTHFRLWYSQSGTPEISAKKIGGPQQSQLCLTQQTPATADQDSKQTMFIPLNISLLRSNGEEVFFDEALGGTFVLDKPEHTLMLPGSLGHKDEVYTPVFLSNFSAPVKVHYNYEASELLHIVSHAGSHYAKWDASQMLYAMMIEHFYQNNESADVLCVELFNSLISYLEQSALPMDVLAQILTLPSFETLCVSYQDLYPLRLNGARDSVNKILANVSYMFANKMIASFPKVNYEYEQKQVNARSLKAVCLRIIALANSSQAISDNNVSFTDVYSNSDNMSDKLSALKAAQQSDNLDEFDRLMQLFEEEYGHDSVVMDKWFALHATAPRKDILSRLDLLKAHSTFSIKNPNKVRAVVGSFAFYNTQGFHALDGSGYRYLADYLMELDKLNSQVAARLVTPMLQLQRYCEPQQALIKVQLTRLFNSKGLSRDLFEKLSKTLSKL
jgi:aminopeptidase N